MLTLTEAARQLGVTAATLRQQIHAGHLDARKLGPIWIISETALARYQLENRGRVGRPFVGRPGYVDTQHVRVRILFAPADGRGHDAIWLQYLSESFVFDRDWGNPKPFRWRSEDYQAFDQTTTPPGGRVIELWNRNHLARELETPPDHVDVLMKLDPSFPGPVVTFRDGPVWDRISVERWLGLRANSSSATGAVSP